MRGGPKPSTALGSEYQRLLATVESIVDGTWGSGPPPAEWVEFTLMHQMRWSFEQMRATPPYVRRYCYDFLGIVAEHEAWLRKQADDSRGR